MPERRAYYSQIFCDAGQLYSSCPLGNSHSTGLLFEGGGGGSVLVLISSIIPTTVLHTYVAYVCDKTWMARPAATYVGRLGLGEAQAGSILVLVHRILALSHACFDSLKESPLVVLLVI